MKIRASYFNHCSFQICPCYIGYFDTITPVSSGGNKPTMSTYHYSIVKSHDIYEAKSNNDHHPKYKFKKATLPGSLLNMQDVFISVRKKMK